MPRKLVGWKAWYVRDGKLQIFTSRTVKWQDLPFIGMQFFKRFWLHEERVQNRILPENVTGQNFFFLTVCEENKLIELLHNGKIGIEEFSKYAKRGELLPAETFGRIYKQAKADTEIIEEMI